MVELVVYQYDDVAGADRAAARLLRSLVRGAEGGHPDLGVSALAVIWWPTRAARPSYRPVECDGVRAVTPAFWGLVLGLVFYLPLVGAALGRTTGTVADLLADLGIGDTFVNRMRDQVVPGTSSLAMLAAPEGADALREHVGAVALRSELVARLDDRQQAALWTVFGR